MSSMQLFNVNHVFYLLNAINLLLYVSRAIVPGAPVQFQAFIQESLHVPPDSVSVYIGILVTAFVAAYSAFISLFGYLSMHRRPFRLAGSCLFVWVLSMVLCGLAKSTRSYWLLLAGRVLAGVGESAFQAAVPSFIDEFAPLEKRAWWMGLFACCLSAGTALGFTYGSLMAQSIGWDYAYYILAVVMAPLSYLCAFCIPDLYNMPLSHDSMAHNSKPGSSLAGFADMWAILKTALFIVPTIGWAAYAFSISGLAAFGPALLIGLGVLEERICSTVFGGIVVLAGLLGSPLGGYLVDRQCRGRENESAWRHYVVTRLMFIMAIGALAFALASVIAVDFPWAILVLMFIALVCLFVTTSPFTVGILLSVNKSHRGFAIGLSTALLHVLGDLPAPLILGTLKDKWAPHCGSVTVNGTETLNPDCLVSDKAGLTSVLVFAYAWLGWTVLFYGITFVMARRQLHTMSKLFLQFETSITPIVMDSPTISSSM
ncbi:Aste57867_17777 [Aphanomyces stellatus]|uniref:Aste57867_17777 protein n=1 Tax=Aphanomyces stellatus TaxID=120398 RepID=A0A485L9B3_9STRA|nr:hypothetical protein As57867_017716 [Aphanomyces stellatus]VFT94522.1 Aste57867_17777 [Aphanomyces stellatus]